MTEPEPTLDQFLERAASRLYRLRSTVAPGTKAPILEEINAVNGARHRIDELEFALRWALTFIAQSREPPDSGEAREDYCGATRIAWPDDPDQWEPEDQPGGDDVGERYIHRNLSVSEGIEVATRFDNLSDLPTGIFYEGNLVAVVPDDSSGIGSGIADLMNAIDTLAHVTQPPEES